MDTNVTRKRLDNQLARLGGQIRSLRLALNEMEDLDLDYLADQGCAVVGGAKAFVERCVLDELEITDSQRKVIKRLIK